jgi:hypothetical protein
MRHLLRSLMRACAAEEDAHPSEFQLVVQQPCPPFLSFACAFGHLNLLRSTAAARPHL